MLCLTEVMRFSNNDVNACVHIIYDNNNTYTSRCKYDHNRFVFMVFFFYYFFKEFFNRIPFVCDKSNPHTSKSSASGLGTRVSIAPRAIQKL